MMRSSVLSFLIVSSVAYFAVGETVDEYHTRLESLLETAFANQNESTAWWVGVSHPTHGDNYWIFGNSSDTDATFPPDVPATIDDHFYIGSISKTFGATVNLRLIEQGLFSLNQIIDSIIPDFVAEFPQYSNYTPADLMGMQTLVPDFLNDPNGIANKLLQDPSTRYSIFEIVNSTMTRYPVEFPYPPMKPEDFGLKEYYEYSTTNILAMEYLAENVTGKQMQDLVQELVLAPLGLQNTAQPPRDCAADYVVPEPTVTSYIGQGCVHEFSEVGANGSLGYRNDEFFNSICQVGTGGSMYSSITDLLQWAKSGVGDSLLSPETVAERHIFNLTSLAIPYGLGMMETIIETDYGVGWFGHDGDAFGSNARASKNDELGVSFASAINTCGYGGLHTDGMKILVSDIMMDDTDSPSSAGFGRLLSASSKITWVVLVVLSLSV